MYAIRCLLHRTDLGMGAHGFMIDLSPEFKERAAASKLNQKNMDGLVENCGSHWLKTTGFDYCSDRPLMSLRILWGDWGPEHITVPGNACGLDIDRRPCGCLYRGGVSLLPHNIDSWRQKYLLLVTFCEITETIMLFTDDRLPTIPERGAE